MSSGMMQRSEKMDPVEKRRMQNRIAQRNHRNRVKQNNQLKRVTAEESSQSNSKKRRSTTQSSTLSPVVTDVNPLWSQAFASGDLPPLGNEGTGADIDPSDPSHVDPMVLRDEISLLQVDPVVPMGGSSSLMSDKPPGRKTNRWDEFLRFNNGDTAASLPGWMLCTPNWQFYPPTSPSALDVDFPAFNLPPIATSNPPETLSSMARDSVPSQWESLDLAMNTSPDMSDRYQFIIESVKHAGFSDFDTMVAGYYTLSFPKNSVADRAQKLSRAKRLRTVLSSLSQHSQKWTTWEVRGFQEQITEAAEGIYASEFSQLTPGAPTGPPPQTQSTSSSSSTYGDIDPALADENSKAPTLDELHRLYQNKVPNLWALLTELAGASGPQTQEATVLALSLLHTVRMKPHTDVKDLIRGLLDSTDGSSK